MTLSASRARVRPLSLDDYAPAAALLRANGLSPGTMESWRKRWVDNPALEWQRRPQAIGWVLEQDGRIVGMLGNMAQLYHLNGRTLAAAVAARFAVAPEARGSSLELVKAFASQGGVDLLLNTTASVEAAKVFAFFKLKRIPQPDYDLTLTWILEPAALAAAALRKKSAPSWMAALASRAPSLAWAQRWFRPRVRRPALDVKVIGGGEAGSEFDELWMRLSAVPGRLLACRTARDLRWRFDPAGKENPPRLVCVYGDGRLAGYAAVIRRDNPRIGLQRARIADLAAAGDDPGVIGLLIEACADQAARDGAHLIELIGFPEPVRRVALSMRPRRIQETAWPFFYRALDAEAGGILAGASAWYASCYDGDGS